MTGFLTPVAHERYKQLYKPSSGYLKGIPEFSFAAPNWNFHSRWHVAVKLHAKVNYRLENDAFAQEPGKAEDIEFRWKDLLWHHLKAALFILKNVSQITEYYLPFFVALVPLVYVLCRFGWIAWQAIEHSATGAVINLLEVLR